MQQPPAAALTTINSRRTAHPASTGRQLICHGFRIGAPFAGTASSGNAAISFAANPNTPTERAMFLTICSPRSAKAIDSLSRILLVGRARDAHPARLTQGFKAGGDVHPIAEDVVAVDDDVADVDADAKDDLPIDMNARIVRQHRLLDRHRAGDGIDHAGEFHQQAIASGLDDTAMVAGDDADRCAPGGAP